MNDLLLSPLQTIKASFLWQVFLWQVYFAKCTCVCTTIFYDKFVFDKFKRCCSPPWCLHKVYNTRRPTYHWAQFTLTSFLCWPYRRASFHFANFFYDKCTCWKAKGICLSIYPGLRNTCAELPKVVCSSCFKILRIHFKITRKTQEIAFQGFPISKFSRGGMPPDPPR